jgi:glycine cleavage system H protein
MNIPKDLLYTPEHLWVKEENGVYRCGITDFAQEELGDLVYVELPKPNLTVKKGDKIGDVESIKTVSNLYSPISGVHSKNYTIFLNHTKITFPAKLRF